MYRRVIAMFAALFMAAGLLVASTSPAHAGNYYCVNSHNQGSRTFKGDEFVKFTVFFRQCTPYDVNNYYAFVKPYMVLVSYNMPGSYMTCNSFQRKYDGVKFNWYFWRPYDGKNFNPGAKHIPCDESTFNSGVQEWSLKNVPRLYFGPGYGSDRQPRWKVNLTLQMNFASDQHKSHAQDFKLKY